MVSYLRAAVLEHFRSPLTVKEVPTPQIGPTDLLLSIKASSICHTDLNVMDGTFPNVKLPLILGHEIAGVISEVGADVHDKPQGKRVIVYGSFYCGKCVYCRSGRENLCSSPVGGPGITSDGGFSEYICIPSNAIVELPTEIPFEYGAILGCAGITAYHAIKEVANLRIGESAAIFGVGGLGMIAIQIAKACGAKVIAVDILDKKLDLAKKLGADYTINSQRTDPSAEVGRLTGGEGVDAALQLTPSPKVTDQATKSLKKDGRVAIVGWGEQPRFEVSTLDIIDRQTKLTGSNLGRKADLEEVTDLVKRKRISLDPLITHKVSLGDVNNGLKIARTGQAIKVIVTP